MADEAQSLQEFTKNLLSDVESGAISVHEALAAAEQYSYLREEISAASLTLSEAAAAGDDELTQAFIALISATIEKITELPNFQSQKPDSLETEKEIRDTASLQKTAATRLREATANKPGKDARRAFVHDLVAKFSATVPSLSEREMERLVNASAATAAQQSTSEQEGRFRTELSTRIAGVSENDSPEQRRRIESIVDTAVKTRTGAVTDHIRVMGEEVAVFSVLFNAEDMKRPDVFADIVLHAPGSENLDQTLARAEKLARAAQALEEAAGSRGGRLQFFSSDGAKGVAGGLQKGADGILSLVGEPVRDMVLREKVNGTLRSMLAGTQQFADRLGESFVHSALFTHIGQDLTKQLSQKPQGGGAGGVLGDVFSTVFRGPLSLPLERSTKNAILDYYELARANAAAPPGRAFLAPGVFPWDIFRVTEGAKNAASSIRAGGARSRSLFPFFGLGSAGSVIGDFLSGLVDRATSFALLNPRLPGQLSAGRRAAAIPTAIVDDMPLFVALVVVIVLVLFFIFPSPLNITQISHSSKITALFSSLTAKEDVPATTNNNGWPVKCGCIINGPFEDTHSDNQLNAIDFNFEGCSPKTNVGLYATAKGKVTAISQQYGVGETCFSRAECGGRSTYGNYIQITITEGPANGYVLLYAHMATIKVHEGQSVEKGDLVGTSNHNGLSYQEHLHFEVMGSHSHPPLNQTNPVTPQAATNGLCVSGGI